MSDVKEPARTDPEREASFGRVALWLDADDLRWLARHCCCPPDASEEQRQRCAQASLPGRRGPSQGRSVPGYRCQLVIVYRQRTVTLRACFVFLFHCCFHSVVPRPTVISRSGFLGLFRLPWVRRGAPRRNSGVMTNLPDLSQINFTL